MIKKDRMLFRFSLYGFLKNLRFFEPFILLIFQSYGFSFFQIGILYSIRDISTNILEVPTGLVADIIGRRKAMIGAFVSYIISFILFYAFNRFEILVVAMIIFAFGEAFRTGTHKALILEHLKINQISNLKVAYYGFTRSASQIGSALNVLIASGLVFYSGSFRIMFLVSIIPYLLDLFNLATYPKKLDGEIPGLKSGEIGTRIKNTLRDFWKIFSDRYTLKTFLNSASFSGVFKASKDYLQPILATFALSLAWFGNLDDVQREAVVIGGVYVFIYILTSLASRSAYQISSRFGSYSRAINITFLIGGMLLLISGITAARGVFVIAVICFVGLFFLNNVRRPINIGLISDQISSRIMASGLSAEAQLTTIFAALVAPLLGFLADSLGVGQGLSMIGLLLLFIYLPIQINDTKSNLD
jgi:MFS family permease